MNLSINLGNKNRFDSADIENHNQNCYCYCAFWTELKTRNFEFAELGKGWDAHNIWIQIVVEFGITKQLPLFINWTEHGYSQSHYSRSCSLSAHIVQGRSARTLENSHVFERCCGPDECDVCYWIGFVVIVSFLH